MKKSSFSCGGDILVVKVLAAGALLSLLEVVEAILGKFGLDNVLSCGHD